MASRPGGRPIHLRALVSSSIALVLSLSTVLALGVALGAGPAAAKGHPRMMLGPGDAKVHNVKDKALIRNSKYGPIYIAGQQHSHLRITHVKKLNSLRFRDTRTKHLGAIPDRCHREKVKKGISAVCTIPKRFDDQKMFVQVWPRLGNDYVDGRTLPHRFRMWVLTDAGNDTVYGGAGNDFVNGAKGNDKIIGGPGNDFLRGGPGADRIVGGKGKDRISRN